MPFNIDMPMRSIERQAYYSATFNKKNAPLANRPSKVAPLKGYQYNYNNLNHSRGNRELFANNPR